MFFIFHTPFGEIFGFVGSSLIRIGFLPFGIYKTLAEKLSLKMPKSLEKSRLFGGTFLCLSGTKKMPRAAGAFRKKLVASRSVVSALTSAM
ncbi:MAG: hypothetical protein ACOX6U_08275 [Oscillospiraceae bacterium]|jgi:hypothetical protein